jgi:hypothetical protein
MNIPQLPVSGTQQDPESAKQYVVTIGVVVTDKSALAAADRVADLGRRLTEHCEIDDWSLQSLESLEGGAAHESEVQHG